MLILGIDPGLQKTGWGIIQSTGNALKFINSGVIKTNAKRPLYARLAQIDRELEQTVKLYKPHVAAIEITFMNNNPSSALKLGVARGVGIITPARFGLEVHEYAANLVKKSVVGVGHASKDQINMMIKTLLPTCGKISEDEADALAIAITHAHHSSIKQHVKAY